MYWLLHNVSNSSVFLFFFFCDLNVPTDLFHKAGDCYRERILHPREVLCPPGTFLVVYSGNDTLMHVSLQHDVKLIQHGALEVQTVSIKSSSNVFFLIFIIIVIII